MRKREYSQISFDDLLGVPTAGEIVESHGRRLSFDEAAARIGEIVILNISTENHEWFRAVRVLKAVVTPDGERRLIGRQLTVHAADETAALFWAAKRWGYSFKRPEYHQSASVAKLGYQPDTWQGALV